MFRQHFDPSPEVNDPESMHNPPRPLLVYTSSIPGAITVALDVDGHGHHREGLRLDRAQVEHLAALLNGYLAGEVS